MSLASFALILGAVCYIFGFPVVFADEAFAAWRRRIASDEQSLRLLGMALVMVALTTLRYHWRLSFDGEGLVIVLAWVTLLKGLWLSWWPRIAVRIATSIDAAISTPQRTAFCGSLVVFVGALLTYLGLVLA